MSFSKKDAKEVAKTHLDESRGFLDQWIVKRGITYNSALQMIISAFRSSKQSPKRATRIIRIRDTQLGYILDIPVVDAARLIGILHGEKHSRDLREFARDPRVKTGELIFAHIGEMRNTLIRMGFEYHNLRDDARVPTSTKRKTAVKSAKALVVAIPEFVENPAI